jgi:transposase
MSYIRIKKIKDKTYKFLVTAKRVNGKVQQKVLRYLGPTNPIYKTGRKRGKSNASIYVDKLPELDKFELTKATHSQSSFVKDRARIILLSSQGYYAKPISELIGCEERKVRIAIKEYNKKGLNFLIRGKAKGAEIKFSEECKKIILMHFSKPPKEFGLHFTTWTLPRFTKHLIDYKVVDSISIEKVRQILDKSGARLKRSKRWQYSPDKEFDKKNLQLNKS